MRKTVITAAALFALATISPAGAADPSTAVTTLNATVGTNVAVSGAATFVDVPVTVGTDEDGASPNGIGADVRKLTIARPSGNNLKFTMEIDDFSAAGGVPNIVYLWPLMVNGEDTQLFLMAGRAGGFPNPSTDPGFAVMVNSPDGFSPVADVSGTLGNGSVTWTVPMGSIGGKDNYTIEAGGGAPASTRPGVHQTFWLGSPVHDSYFVEEIYTIPGNTVKLGIAPAGTAAASVPLTVNATVNKTTGAFNGSIPKPATPGDYIVVAQACFGPQSCGALSTTTITVA